MATCTLRRNVCPPSRCGSNRLPLSTPRCCGGRQSSTVEIGTQYELLVASLLQSHGARIARTGGRGDRGIDLRGEWNMSMQALQAGASWRPGQALGVGSASGTGQAPPATAAKRPVRVVQLAYGSPQPSRWPVLGQCKATHTPVGTGVMRDFQAALESSETNTLGVIACTHGFALREIASQPSLVVRYTLLLHLTLDGALLTAHMLQPRTGPAAACQAPPLLVQPVLLR